MLYISLEKVIFLYLIIILLIIKGCLIVILYWNETNLPDRITGDEWIKTWILKMTAFVYIQYIWIEKPVIKCDQLRDGKYWRKWYNNRLDQLITFLIINTLLNINKDIWENIHICTNHYCKYIDQTLFWSWLGWNPDNDKQWLTVMIDV